MIVWSGGFVILHHKLFSILHFRSFYWALWREGRKRDDDRRLRRSTKNEGDWWLLPPKNTKKLSFLKLLFFYFVVNKPKREVTKKANTFNQQLLTLNQLNQITSMHWRQWFHLFYQLFCCLKLFLLRFFFLSKTTLKYNFQLLFGRRSEKNINFWMAHFFLG